MFRSMFLHVKLLVSGETYRRNYDLKQLGGRYSKKMKCWVLPVESQVWVAKFFSNEILKGRVKMRVSIMD